MLIFDGEEIAVHLNKGASDFLLITFIGIGHEERWRDQYFAKPFVEKEQINCLGIVTKKRNWYVSDEMQEVLKYIDQIRSFYKKIVTIGLSSGGYAALKYSSLLKSNFTIVMAPQLSIDPDEWPTIPEWAQLCSQKMKGMGIKVENVQGSILILYDKKHDIDRKTAEHILSFNQNGVVDVKILSIPYAGHIIYESIKGSETLKKLISYSLDNNRNFPRLFKDLMAIRRKNYVNIYNKLMAGYFKHPLLCYQILNSDNFLKVKYYNRILLDETNLFKIVAQLAIYNYQKEASRLFLLLSFYYASKKYDLSRQREYKGNRIALLDHRGRFLAFSNYLHKFISNNPTFNPLNSSLVYLTFINDGLYPYVEYLDRKFYFEKKNNQIFLTENCFNTDDFVKVKMNNKKVCLYHKNNFLSVVSDDNVNFNATTWFEYETFIPIYF